MNTQQTQKPNTEQSPSFDDVSKFFSLPLSEAADIPGVSVAVLKKICIDNGLERWPHRKYLSGKSIEEIKKEAAREKNKATATSTIDRNRTNLAMSGARVKDKAFRSPQDISNNLNVQQQPGSRSVFTLRPHQEFYTPNFGIESLSGLHEFKYGFPSDGLSASSNQWWGSESTTDDDGVKSTDQTEGSESSDGETQQIGLLSSIRKRALEEGREIIEFGFWKEFGAQKVGKKENLLLTRIFG